MHTGCLHPLNDKIKLPMRHVEFMKGIFMDNITIRTAKPSDADKLLEIYAPYVEKRVSKDSILGYPFILFNKFNPQKDGFCI